MNKLIIIDPLHKKRGIFKSLFFYLSKKRYYIDEGNSYSYRLMDFSKVNKKYLKEVLEVINKEEEAKGNINNFSIENEEESLIMSCSLKKEYLVKMDSFFINIKEKYTGIIPFEYLIGKYFAENNKSRNVQINFFSKDCLYIFVIHQGTLIWIEKTKGKESLDENLYKILMNDIYEKEGLYTDDLKKRTIK